MLGKLIKYELKATSRWFVPVYILALFLSVLERLTFAFAERDLTFAPPFDKLSAVIFVVITIAYVISLVAIGVASFLLIVYRFYKNLVTNEGYLMHTLPVKTSQLIWSKAIAALLWMIVSGLVIFLSIFLLAVGSPGWNQFISELGNVISLFFREYGGNSNVWKGILELLLMAFIASFQSIFMLYAAIALGQLVTKHKIIGSFGAYLLINMALQFVTSMGLFPLINKMNGLEFQTVDEAASFMLNIVFPLSILGSAAIAAVFYFITCYIFKNQLNLE